MKHLKYFEIGREFENELLDIVEKTIKTDINKIFKNAIWEMEGYIENEKLVVDIWFEKPEKADWVKIKDTIKNIMKNATLQLSEYFKNTIEIIGSEDFSGKPTSDYSIKLPFSDNLLRSKKIGLWDLKQHETFKNI